MHSTMGTSRETQGRMGLSEISQDVALRVVVEAGGNQTAAAKRLGISRTTLWRLLQK